MTLDLGGQIHIAGNCDEMWVEVADPDGRHDTVARLALSTGSIATSGNSERGRTVGGVPLGHLLDPRNGRPVPDWGAVTVVAADPVAADCLSTALFVMGPEYGPRWLHDRPGIDAVFVERGEEGTTMYATPGLRRRLIVDEADPVEFVENLTGITKTSR